MATKLKRKILLIDDDTSLLTTLRDFLEFEGYDVLTAESGEQGLKRLDDVTPDLIILDMSMPGMGGVGFLKAISGEGGKPKHPVLVLTARANMAEFFANVDVDGFIAKPCDPNDLLMEVGRILFLRHGKEAGEPRGPRGERKRVLVAEGDSDLNRKLVTAFGEAGYTAEGVQTGPEVLERAIVGKPDVIVVRYVLTNMNGDAVARLLREMPNTSRIPVVLYDDSQTLPSDASALEVGTSIRKVVRSRDAESLVEAVGGVLVR